MIDIENLEALAKTATPGPWTVDEECLAERDRLYVAKGKPGNLRGRILEVFANCLVRHAGRADNAKFIAAANPKAILEMAAEIRRLRTEVNDFTTAVGEMNEEVVRLRARTIEQCAAAAQMCAHGLTFGVDRRIHHNNAVADCVDAINALAKEKS